MKTFDPHYKLLDEMYQDDYYPAFLVDKVKDELQKVVDLLESGEEKNWPFVTSMSVYYEVPKLTMTLTERLDGWQRAEL